MAPKTPTIMDDRDDDIKIEVVDIDVNDVGQEDLDSQSTKEKRTNIMESAVINASGDPRAVVFSDGRRHHDQINHLDELIAREQAAFGREAALNAQTTMRDVKDTRFDLSGDISRVGAAGAVAACHTDQLVQSTSCRTDGIVTTGFAGVQAGFSNVHDRLCDGFDKTRATVVHGTEEAHKEYDQLQKQISDSATSTLVGFKDLTALSYQIQGASLLEAAKNAAAITLQATTNANAASVQAQNFTNLLQVQAMTNFNALNVEMVKNAAAAELRAQTIAAAAAAQAAECCCELKELIRADGDKTRALINTNTIEQLRAQLVATQRLIPPTIPVGAG